MCFLVDINKVLNMLETADNLNSVFLIFERARENTGGVTITPDDFWTEWCYSGHSGRFCRILGRVVL